MNNKQAKAIYDDIYSIYEQNSTNYFLFEGEVRQKYTLTQILLVCNIYNVTNVKGNKYVHNCHVHDPWVEWSLLKNAISDIFIAFTPSNEFILK
jgi:hypothetical protein